MYPTEQPRPPSLHGQDHQLQLRLSTGFAARCFGLAEEVMIFIRNKKEINVEIVLECSS